MLGAFFCVCLWLVMSSKMLVPLTLKIEKISKPRDLNFDQHKPLLKSGVMLSSLTWYMAYLYSMQIGLERGG